MSTPASTSALTPSSGSLHVPSGSSPNVPQPDQVGQGAISIDIPSVSSTDEVNWHNISGSKSVDDVGKEKGLQLVEEEARKEARRNAMTVIIQGVADARMGRGYTSEQAKAAEELEFALQEKDLWDVDGTPLDTGAMRELLTNAAKFFAPELNLDASTSPPAEPEDMDISDLSSLEDDEPVKSPDSAAVTKKRRQVAPVVRRAKRLSDLGISISQYVKIYLTYLSVNIHAVRCVAKGHFQVRLVI